MTALRIESEFEDTRLRPRKLKNWKPKKWRVEYERIVALSVTGHSNKMIALQTGYTTVHVSNILQMDEAEDLRQLCLTKMRERAVEKSTNIDAKLEEAAVLATKRIIEVLKDDSLVEKSPFAVFDRSMEVLKGRGNLKSGQALGNGGTNIERAVFINGPAAEKLSEGMSKADLALEVNAIVK